MVKTAAAAVLRASGARPGSFDAAIDLEHLQRMTFGDRSLQDEILRLFDRQAAMLAARMTGAPPAIVAALAHTLKGSARGIGAGRVALATEAVEIAAASPGAAGLAAAIDEMVAAIAEVRVAIGALLQSA